MLWEEIPVYWSIAFNNEKTYQDAENQLGELMKRDKNRASVVIWSVGNENPDTDERFTFMSNLASYAKGNGIGFGVQSMNHSKDHVVASAYASAELSDRWEIGGAVEQGWSRTSRDLSAAVNVAYRF